MRYRLIIIIFFSLVLSGFSDIQAAKSKSEQNKTQVKKKTTISKSTAIKVAKSEVRGKVLSAKLIESRGPSVYRVKMLVSDSRVRTVFVDGATGRVIRIN